MTHLETIEKQEEIVSKTADGKMGRNNHTEDGK